MGSIPGFSSLLDETLNPGPMTTFQDKLLTKADCDEAGDYVVPNVLSPRDVVFRPDIGHKLFHHLANSENTDQTDCWSSLLRVCIVCHRASFLKLRIIMVTL